MLELFLPKLMGFYKRNFTSSTLKLPLDLVYKFHHIDPFKKVIPRDSENSNSAMTVDGEQYSLLYQSLDLKKSNIYAYILGELKWAIDAKKLSQVAQLVPWNIILTSHEKIMKFVNVDVSVYDSYMPIGLINSFSEFIVSYESRCVRTINHEVGR